MSAQVAIRKLEDYAGELDKRSSELTDTQRELDTVEPKYRDFIEAYETALYDAADGGKLPSEKMRLALAHRAMPRELLESYRTLLAKRERLKKKIADLKVAVEAQRSVLSAEKVALEAGGA